jgi:hypothetical protein
MTLWLGETSAKVASNLYISAPRTLSMVRRLG